MEGNLKSLQNCLLHFYAPSLALFFLVISENWSTLISWSFMEHHSSKLWPRQEWFWSWKSAKETWKVVYLRTRNAFLGNLEIVLSSYKPVDGWYKSPVLWRTYTRRELSTGTSSLKTFWYETLRAILRDKLCSWKPSHYGEGRLLK